jgi:DNA-binding transcriptional LysR family regulator
VVSFDGVVDFSLFGGSRSSLRTYKKFMFMHLQHLKSMAILALIGRHGSMAKVSDALGSTPSMVTKQLQALEAAAGVQLVVRSTRGLRLTNTAQQWLPTCEALLEAASHWPGVSNSNVNVLHGRLRMSVPTTLAFPRFAQLLAKFRLAHSEIQVDLDVRDEHLDLMRDDLDLILHVGTLPDSRYVAHRLFSTHGVLVIHESHEEFMREHNPEVAPTALLLPHWRGRLLGVLSAPGDGRPLPTPVQAALDSQRIVYCNQWSMIAQLLVAMPSFVMLPEFVLNEVGATNALIQPWPHLRSDAVDMFALTPDRLDRSPIAKAFVQLLLQELAV